MSSPALPADFLGVACVVLLLGMRHGFDADHLAAIDGMTSHNARARPALARVSLLTAALVLATLLAPAADAWARGKELWFGSGVVVVLLASFLLGQRLAGPAAPVAPKR